MNPVQETSASQAPLLLEHRKRCQPDPQRTWWQLLATFSGVLSLPLVVLGYFNLARELHVHEVRHEKQTAQLAGIGQEVLRMRGIIESLEARRKGFVVEPSSSDNPDAVLNLFQDVTSHLAEATRELEQVTLALDHAEFVEERLCSTVCATISYLEQMTNWAENIRGYHIAILKANMAVEHLLLVRRRQFMSRSDQHDLDYRIAEEKRSLAGLNNVLYQVSSHGSQLDIQGIEERLSKLRTRWVGPICRH